MIRKFLIAWFSFFFGLAGKNNLKENKKWLWAICGVNWKVATYLFNKYMLLYAKLGHYPTKAGNIKNDIVVSLTTFPARINSVWIVIDSLLRQKTVPGKICLYLAENEFPNGEEGLPERLLKYKEYGLEINIRKENLMAHNKYFYALQEHKDKCVITVDDDFYYPVDTISRLVELHEANPGVVCSNSIHVFTFNDDDSFKSYDEWIPRAPRQNASHMNVALGYNGVLYPPVNYGEKMFDTTMIRETSLKADDLWLKALEIEAGIKVVNGDYFCTGIELGGTQTISLSKTNINNGFNDKQWIALCKAFNITKSSLN